MSNYIGLWKGFRGFSFGWGIVHHWKNATIGYCFRMITSLLIPGNAAKYLMVPKSCDTIEVSIRCQCSGKTWSLSESLYLRAKMIFLLVSIRQGFPHSILLMVWGDIPAFLASSALLIKSPSLIFRKVLRPNLSSDIAEFVPLLVHPLLQFLSTFKKR